jgi:hypothetical protein
MTFATTFATTFDTTLIIIFLLFTKHFIVDFPLQTRYQWSNKGTYGHAGGVLHAWLHGLGTFLCFYWLDPAHALWYAGIDALIHYHIDWAKMNLNAKLKWGPTTHEQFWWLLGADQYLHALTYIAITWWAVK